MDPTYIGAIVFACTLGGAMAGMWLRTRLPEQHLSSESRDTVKLSIGLIATMTALVLGLVTASAKKSFDEVDATVKDTALDILALDRTLARYGPDTSSMRDDLLHTVESRVNNIWPPRGLQQTMLDPPSGPSGAERIVDAVRTLTPGDDFQRSLQSLAIDDAEKLLEVRWLASALSGNSVPRPFLVVLLFWLSITFMSFGLYAPRNATVFAALFVCAMSVGSAVFLVLEMDGPFEGLLKVSEEPLRYAITHLNK